MIKAQLFPLLLYNSSIDFCKMDIHGGMLYWINIALNSNGLCVLKTEFNMIIFY